eukprot:Selendium_serpulae@DN9451_c0_g1_i1.p1
MSRAVERFVGREAATRAAASGAVKGVSQSVSRGASDGQSFVSQPFVSQSFVSQSVGERSRGWPIGSPHKFFLDRSAEHFLSQPRPARSSKQHEEIYDLWVVVCQLGVGQLGVGKQQRFRESFSPSRVAQSVSSLCVGERTCRSTKANGAASIQLTTTEGGLAVRNVNEADSTNTQRIL